MRNVTITALPVQSAQADGDRAPQRPRVRRDNNIDNGCGNMQTVHGLLEALQAYVSGSGVFNPWRDVDLRYDRDPDAPVIRSTQLEHYLEARTEKAKCLLVGEAIGYQGGRFSGIAMMSERILLRHRRGLDPTWVLPNLAAQRTSRPDLRPNGFTEPTATVAWNALISMGLSPLEFVIWNAFPFHPFHPAKGSLTNRKPSPAELQDGARFLQAMRTLFPEVHVVAIGKTSDDLLSELGVAHTKARHPANGGASQFRQEVRVILGAAAAAHATGSTKWLDILTAEGIAVP